MDFPFSFSALAIAIGVSLSTYFIRNSFEKLFSKKEKKKYAPVVATIFDLIKNFHRAHDFTTDIARKHKTYRIWFPSHSETSVLDPINVEYVLKTNFSNYGKGWYHYDILSDLLGDGIFTVDGEKWRHQRKISSHEFSTKILRDFSSEVFRENAVKLAQVVLECVDANQSVEVQELFMKSTLDSVFKVVLGVDLDSMCGTNERATEFTNAFNEASEITTHRYIDLLWRIKRYFNIGSEARLKILIEVVNEFVYKLIQSKIEQVHKSQLDSSLVAKKGDILSRFLEANETDTKYLKDIILSFIVAGKDTTASTLSWFLYMMCKNPLIQEKIAREVWEATKITQGSSFEELATSISEEALDKMQYLHAALSETLRLYPAVPAEKKLCFADDTLPDGYSIRKGEQLMYHPYAMGRMKYLWGDDAEEYRPERWLNEDGLYQPQSSFKFTAFQAGPRICLGKEFAYRQMKIFAAVLVGSFTFKLSEEQKRVDYKLMLTLHIDGGLHLQASHKLKI